MNSENKFKILNNILISIAITVALASLMCGREKQVAVFGISIWQAFEMKYTFSKPHSFGNVLKNRCAKRGKLKLFWTICLINYIFFMIIGIVSFWLI